jgi:prepilin-type processing-associated H-X9-DG protein
MIEWVDPGVKVVAQGNLGNSWPRPIPAFIKGNAMRTGRKLVMRGLIVGAVAFILSVASFTVAVRQDMAARFQCRDNLLALGLALAEYHDAFETLPCGTVVNPELPPQKRLSWLTVIMNEQGRRLQIDTTKAWDAAENRPPSFLHEGTTGDAPPTKTSAANVALFNCPSHSPTPDPTGLGPTDYVGIAGLGKDAATLPLTHSRAGVFGYNRATRLRDITDGASETLMIAETAQPQGAWTAGGRSTVRGLNRDRRPYLGPNGQFGGNHRGGTMVVFADGSVRMIRDTISPAVFESLSTIAGGDQIKPGSLSEAP